MVISIFWAKTLELNAEALTRLRQADLLSARAIPNSKRRTEFVSGRLLAQKAGQMRLGVNDLSLEPQASGPPRLSSSEAGNEVHKTFCISISHSQGYVVCALAAAEALGVDLELVRARRDIDGLARHVLHPVEWLGFSQLAANTMLDSFYDKWVVKEALGKALGYGIHYPMSSVCIAGEQIIEAPLSWIPQAENWRIQTLRLDTHALGLAVKLKTPDAIFIDLVEVHL